MILEYNVVLCYVILYCILLGYIIIMYCDLVLHYAISCFVFYYGV